MKIKQMFLKPTVDIVTVVGSKDLEILFELLQSIKKYWNPRNPSNIIIYIHKTDLKIVKKIAKAVTIDKHN